MLSNALEYIQLDHIKLFRYSTIPYSTDFRILQISPSRGLQTVLVIRTSGSLLIVMIYKIKLMFYHLTTRRSIIKTTVNLPLFNVLGKSRERFITKDT